MYFRPHEEIKQKMGAKWALRFCMAGRPENPLTRENSLAERSIFIRMMCFPEPLSGAT